MMILNKGDYVLATKWQDGDPGDHWAIGFYTHMSGTDFDPRYMIVDANGQQFRANGFRRVEKISAERGKWLLDRKDEIERSEISLWDWVKKPM